MLLDQTIKRRQPKVSESTTLCLGFSGANDFAASTAKNRTQKRKFESFEHGGKSNNTE